MPYAAPRTPRYSTMPPSIGITPSTGTASLLTRLNPLESWMTSLLASGAVLITSSRSFQLKPLLTSALDGPGSPSRVKKLPSLTHPMLETHWPMDISLFWLWMSGSTLTTLITAMPEQHTFKTSRDLSTGTSWTRIGIVTRWILNSEVIVMRIYWNYYDYRRIIGIWRLLISWIVWDWQAIMFRSIIGGLLDLSFLTRPGIEGNPLRFVLSFRRADSLGRVWWLLLDFPSAFGLAGGCLLLLKDFFGRTRTFLRGSPCML